jgi:DNA-binding transcriptional ArsR family regulator
MNAWCYVNDGTLVSVWQDGRVTEQQTTAAAAQATRTVDTVDVLRALADPTRMSILATLMRVGNDDELPVMSVKELAAELGEPQTKLYRHVRQLEAAGLVRVAATRMVSGILEQRYQACQPDLSFGRGFLREHGDESAPVVRTLLDRFRDGFFTAFRDERLAREEAVVPYRKPAMMLSEVKLTPAKAAELRGKLEQVMEWLNGAANADPGGVRVNVLIGYYSPADPDTADADTADPDTVDPDPGEPDQAR